MWSPEGFENDQGRLQQVDVIFLRTRFKKCFVCNGRGASLGCMYRGARCCRPMHFRCALVGGASLRDWYQTFCPPHASLSCNADQPMHFLEQTPVSDVLIKQGNGCSYCSADSYDRSRGTILTCNKCLGRAHSRCINPKLKNDIMFSANSFDDKHYCQKCMPCKLCDRPVDKRVYQHRKHDMSITDPLGLSLANDIREDSDTLLCIGCNHFAVHRNCLPPDANPTQWRCDRCFTCRHCDEVDISPEKWNEQHEACQSCFKGIQSGDVICPICDKLYRDFEDVPMVQCDFCDKWIHAISCGGFTAQTFKDLEKKPSASYRCQVCVDEKRTHDPGRRRSKSGKGERDFPQKRTHSEALHAILEKIPSTDGEVAFYCIRPTRRDEGKFSKKTLSDLAIGTELCRLCCSGGNTSSLRFCVTCGDCFHKFCDNMLAKRGSLSDVYQDALEWQCSPCTIKLAASLKSSTTGVASDGGSNTDMVGNGNESIHWEVPMDRRGLAWSDDRVCEFCQRKEVAGTAEGRLLAWGSTVNSDLSDVWVHVGCVMWSVGTIFDGCFGECDTVIGPRRTILAVAKRSKCATCHITGATVKCSKGGCGKMFHFSCATEAGMKCIIVKSGGKKDSSNLLTQQNRLQLVDDDNIQVMCPHHESKSKAESTKKSLVEFVGKVEMERMIRILDSQGYSLDAEAAKLRVVSMDRVVSLRVGSLAVLKFGDVVPEVNDFIVKGCLIPLGYCAARRFWSMKFARRRCTYFLEVRGHAQSGPVFVIRCDESPEWRIEDTSLDAAWNEVWANVMRVQCTKDKGRSERMVQSGLEVFGLERCKSVVGHIESLPLASMFSGRYKSKVGVQEKGKGSDIVFYDSLANNYGPPKVEKNATGSARSEGYVRMKDNTGISASSAEQGGPLPTYENIRSGCAFQLQVIREALCDKEEVGDEKSRFGAGVNGAQGVSNGLNSRSRRCSGTLVEDVKTVELDVEMEDVKPKVRSKKISVENVVSECKVVNNLAPNAKQVTKVLRSEINGWGVFALRDIAAGELIIEYVGDIIRPKVSDLRELQYSRMGIGCYMFEIVPGMIVDATVTGNAARFINHSCAPNCFSKTISVDNRKLVAIFSKRRIQRGEELSYDYKFPYDDSDRVKCGCGAEQCKGFMN